MSNYIPLIIVLALAAFVAFWCLIAKGLSLIGWQRLATDFQVAGLPPGRRFRLGQASVGGVRYQSAITASATPEGMALATSFLFRVGPPPLLIPWSAFGVFQPKKVLWTTSYTTTIQLSSGGSLAFSFSGNDLVAAAQPWLRN